jgi:hypothetical protein
VTFTGKAALIGFVLLGLTAHGWGQVVGASVSGTVRDATGAGLPEVAVTIRNLETGAVRKLVSDEGGRYVARSIAVGPYEVRAEKEGFSSQVRTGIDLVVGQSTTVDITLPVGELRESVTVVEAPSPVSLSTQQTDGLVNERQVKELPLNGRSYDELLTLNSGVVNYTSERSGGTGTSNSSVGNMFAVFGHRPQDNLFLLNGIEYTGASLINITPGGASGQLLGVDAVREFNIVSNTYGAEYGKRRRGAINCTGRYTSSCETTIWTRATFSIRAPFRNSSATNSAERWEGRFRRTRLLCSRIMRDSGSIWV